MKCKEVIRRFSNIFVREWALWFHCYGLLFI